MQHRVVLPALYSMYSNAACSGHDNTATPSKGASNQAEIKAGMHAAGELSANKAFRGTICDLPRAEKSTVYSRLGSSNSINELSHQRATLSLECCSEQKCEPRTAIPGNMENLVLFTRIDETAQQRGWQSCRLVAAPGGVAPKPIDKRMGEKKKEFHQSRSIDADRQLFRKRDLSDRHGRRILVPLLSLPTEEGFIKRPFDHGRRIALCCQLALGSESLDSAVRRYARRWHCWLQRILGFVQGR